MAKIFQTLTVFDYPQDTKWGNATFKYNYHFNDKCLSKIFPPQKILHKCCVKSYFLSGTTTKCDCAHTFWMVNTFRIFSISLLFGGGKGGGGLSHPSLYPD